MVDGAAGGDPGETVVFPTCLVDQLRPDLRSTCLELVRASGPARLAKGTTCCGQPAWNAGFASAARRVARTTLRALRRQPGAVVVPSGSCTTMLREHWPVLFAGSPDESSAREVAGRTVELTSFLEAAPGRSPGDAPVTGLGRVALHDSCHALRELDVKDQPRRLLAEQGIEVVETPGAERCCGFGGTFSVKLPAVSVAMADDKLDEWAAAEVDTVVGGDLSCLVHLQGRARRRGLPLRFAHLAEVLAR